MWLAGHRRRLAALAVAAGLIVVLGGAGYAFVLKSFAYQTPQEPPPRVTLARDVAAGFESYPSGLAEVPVLAWRDVSHRSGQLVTTPDAFAVQLAALRGEGYRSVSLGELEAVAAGRRVPLPGRPVVLTFDDGLSTDWTTVDPILRRYGFRAVVFINPADVAGKSPSYFLTGSELSAMASSGRWDVGLELPGGWRSGREAAAAAARARSRLEGDTGRQVAAFGWPSLKFPTMPDTAGPEAANAALRRQFPAVFGRPARGEASFVVGGSASGPLPRVDVTAADTLRSLSARLRAGVQAPPPRSVLSLPWRPAGGRCEATARWLTVTGSRYALCSVLANGALWTDYGIRLSIAAAPSAPGDTAIVELRLSQAGCLEIAFGRSGLSIKQRIGPRWTLLRRARVLGVGAGALRVSIRLAGRTLWLHAQGGAIGGGAGIGSATSIFQRVSPRVSNGVIALGLVAPGKRAVMTFREVTVFRNG